MPNRQSLIVWAIAEGRSATRGIDQFLMGESKLPAPLACHRVAPTRIPYSHPAPAAHVLASRLRGSAPAFLEEYP